MTNRRTNGGPGTNQYQVRGVAKPPSLKTPELAVLAMEGLDSDQLRQTADNRQWRQAARHLLQGLSPAAYIHCFTGQDARSSTQRFWYWAAIFDPEGQCLLDSDSGIPSVPIPDNTVGDHAEELFGMLDQLDETKYLDRGLSEVSIDLVLLSDLGPLDDPTRTIPEQVVKDPDATPAELVRIASHPNRETRLAALQHPNCPEHIKAIGVLGG